MSQRSRRLRSSQRNINNSSQNSSQIERLTQTQTQLASDDLVQKCVRLFLVKMGSNVPIKRAQIVQQLFKERPGKMYDTVIQQASDILQQVYGLKLRTLDTDTAATKKYILTNDLEHPVLINNSEEEAFKTNITFLVLTHVFMSKDSATEASLWEFLKGLNIVPETEISEVGSVHTFIKQLVKEQYIQLESVGAANEDGETKKKISWGSRAQECVSKMEILQFISKMYGNLNIKSWSALYEDAVKQSGDNTDNEIVLVDDDE